MPLLEKKTPSQATKMLNFQNEQGHKNTRKQENDCSDVNESGREHQQRQSPLLKWLYFMLAIAKFFNCIFNRDVEVSFLFKSSSL